MKKEKESLTSVETIHIISMIYLNEISCFVEMENFRILSDVLNQEIKWKEIHLLFL